MLRSVAALIAVGFGPSLLLAGDMKFDVREVHDISYNPAKNADPKRQTLDLYIPKGAKNFPVMMFVHGGAWKFGDKSQYGPLGELFAKQGIGTAVINYRLTDKAGTIKHPDHIRDVAKAFAWVKEHCGKYGGDKKRLFISGHSAGGHLVALLATDEEYLKAEKCSEKDIRGVIAVSGVYMITSLVLGDVFGRDAAVCKAASPIAHVKANEPPFLIAYGNKDIPFLDLMAEDFGKKLHECKCDAKIMKLNRDHISIVVKMAGNVDDPLTKAMLEFIKNKK